MPVYEYKCPRCKHDFEQVKSMGARDLGSCPMCHTLSDRKVSVCNFSMGWKLSDESNYVKGANDYFVKDM